MWHRRAGKDSIALNWTAPAAHERIGTYWHMLPTQAQGRKTIWDGIDRAGRRMIDQAFPACVRSNIRKDEMKIELRCGSIWQVVGSDNYNNLIGANPIGVIFSEYSVADPGAWDYIRPILAENGGWAIFIYTARGRNHGAHLYEMAKDNPSWFAEILTVDDTGVIGPEIIQDERDSGMSEDMIAQEYYCSFQAAIVGSYYGKQMLEAEKTGRISGVPYEPNLGVETWWDLGVGDSTAIWFVQRSAREIRVIDYYEMSGEGLPHYAKVLKERDYVYTRHIAPHDIEVRELGTGKSRRETAANLGIKFQIAPQLSVDDGIDATRAMLSRCWFDKIKTARLVEAMKQYRKNWDEKLKVFQDHPCHDWASHGADAGRYGAVTGDPKDKIIPAIPAFTPSSVVSAPGAWAAR